jgi:pimeloyl-ACP methyl ester carboxylesterase
MLEELQLRIHGDASFPTLIYLPGLHGDWTLIGGFRHAVDGKVRFVEITYPRTLIWSLDDYAAAVETALAENGITTGWLLGESFSSQVVWSMVARKDVTSDKWRVTRKEIPSPVTCHVSPALSPVTCHFRVQGVILAGGFVKYPNPMFWLMEKIAARISTRLLVRIIFGYAKIARFRYRRSPQTLAAIDEFIARRTELDRRAAQHRLHLVAENDPRPIARRAEVPVFGLTGLFDPIVPWPRVRRWLKKNCPALRDYKIIRRADHNVLSTAPVEASKQILEWMKL